MFIKAIFLNFNAFILVFRMLFVQIDRLFFLEKLKNQSFINSKRLVNEIFEHIGQQFMIQQNWLIRMQFRLKSDQH